MDNSKPCIGLEIEGFVLDQNTLQEIWSSKVQEVFLSFLDNWRQKEDTYEGEIQWVSKEIFWYLTDISLDWGYHILEISTRLPLSSLEELQEHTTLVLDLLRWVLFSHWLIYRNQWSLPSANWLYRTPLPPKNEKRKWKNSRLYNQIWRSDIQWYMTSHQVNIDIKREKLIPMLNALYLDSAKTVWRFANSPALIDGILYKEARDYYRKHMSHTPWENRLPTFPDSPYDSINDLIHRQFLSTQYFLQREGIYYIKKDRTITKHDFIINWKADFLSQEKTQHTFSLTKEDINPLLHINRDAYKVHRKLDDNRTITDFTDAYKNNTLDTFFEEHSKSVYIEIRNCSPSYIYNAMEIPTYFYWLFTNIDEFIDSKKDSDREEAKLTREKFCFG